MEPIKMPPPKSSNNGEMPFGEMPQPKSHLLFGVVARYNPKL
jgi:hypothetical protein